MHVSHEHVASTARTLLFVPGTRPDRFANAAAAGADLVILDLEDAVEPENKNQARQNVQSWLAAGHRAVVRVNSAQSSHWSDDIAMLRPLDVAMMVPKAEDPGVLADAATHNPVIALVETAKGVLATPQLSAVPGVVRTALGHIDLAAEVGVSPDNRGALLFARSTLVMSAVAAGLSPPLDGVTTALDDADALRGDVAHAKALGMDGKLCIHPSQIPIAQAALRPSADETAWARSIASAQLTRGGVTTIDGHMVDPPVVARAQRILQQTDDD